MNISQKLDEIERVANAATEGPWFLDAGGDRGVYTERRPSSTSEDVASAFHREDEAFIADARTTVPTLVAALRAVLDLTGQWEHGATRWANPLPVPVEVAQVRDAITKALGGAA